MTSTINIFHATKTTLSIGFLLVIAGSLCMSASSEAHPVTGLVPDPTAITLGQLPGRPSLYDANGGSRFNTPGAAPINVRAQLLRVRKGAGVQLEPGETLADQVATFAVVSQTSGVQLPFLFHVYMTAATSQLSDFQPGQQWQLQLRQRQGTQHQQFMLQEGPASHIVRDVPLLVERLPMVAEQDPLCNNMLHHNCPDATPQPPVIAAGAEDAPPPEGDLPSPEGEFHPEYNKIPPTTGGGGASAAGAKYGGPDTLWYIKDPGSKKTYWLHQRTRSYRLLDSSHLIISREFGRFATKQWSNRTGLRLSYRDVNFFTGSKKGYNLTMTDGRYGDVSFCGIAKGRGGSYSPTRWTMTLTKIYINRSCIGKYVRKGKYGAIYDGTPRDKVDKRLLQSAICQEIGHGLGLGHGMGDCMAASYFPRWSTQPGERSRKLLHKYNRLR